MPNEANQDARLKRSVKEIIENCGFTGILVDREVQLNWSGDVNSHGTLVAEKEIDVVARFKHGGKTVMLFFECEDSQKLKGPKQYFRGYHHDLSIMRRESSSISVVGSKEGLLQARHFKSVDEIGAGFVFGPRFSPTSYENAEREARRYSFPVWDHVALRYFARISTILTKWTKFEISGNSRLTSKRPKL